ncbi:MAG: guanylate kinase [Vicinamibacteria bacterium]|jgi:guanylate kinase|nr:guanylate kinase [Vicinamibacteria bacterium]MBP9945901.1 guanylate kinase [Vicinamibacteria bacterium]
MSDPLLIIIAAPSGGGKSTVLRRVFAEVPALQFSISHTTRAPRAGEQNGREYFFVDENTFRASIAEGAFLEWAEVHGRLYGTARAELDRARRDGNDLVLDIDVQGAAQILKAHPEALSIFLRPPSLEVLKERLRGRGSESAESLATRLANAEGELDRASEFRHVVVNDRLDDAVDAVKAIIAEARRARTALEIPAPA